MASLNFCIYFLKKFIFSWRIIALECCVGFCHTSTWISHLYICLVAHLCLTLCSSMDCCPLGSSIHGISQARILEWVASLYSRGSSWPRYRTRVSCVSCTDRQVIHHYRHPYVYVCSLALEPPCHLLLHPTPLGCHRAPAWAPSLHSNFLLPIYFTHGNVHISILLSPSLTVSISLFSLSLSSGPAKKFIRTIFLGSIYMC